MTGGQIVDELMTGLVSKAMANFDSKVTEELTNHLFEESGRPFSGMDLVALNIQRGRDHGLPGYIKYLKLCNERQKSKSIEIKSFAALVPIMGLSSAQELTSVYRLASISQVA